MKQVTHQTAPVPISIEDFLNFCRAHFQSYDIEAPEGHSIEDLIVDIIMKLDEESTSANDGSLIESLFLIKIEYKDNDWTAMEPVWKLFVRADDEHFTIQQWLNLHIIEKVNFLFDKMLNELHFIG